MTMLVHFIFGAVVVGALAALGAVGTITGTQCLDGISAITVFLLGAGSVVAGSTLSPSPPAPSPLSAP